ncbi:pentatricopeptide repeat-containing protein [Salix suchowensis]|nr:pentatricopeptide repeat-containing protein [Salix suchowensis]
MRLKTYRGQLLLSIKTTTAILIRRYGTKYTAKITSTSPTGRTVSAKVTPPQPLPTDSRGYPLPRRQLICKATQILLQTHRTPQKLLDPTDPFLCLQNYLSAFSISLTPNEASEILKSLNSPSLALRFFHFCPSLSPDFHHDCFTYSRIILILSKSSLPDRLHLVRSIVLEMERNGVRGSISTVNILIGFYEGSEDLQNCIGLIKKWGLRMTGYTYKCLVQAYLRSRNTEKGFGVYLEMKKKGHMLDIFAYNMLLDALVKDSEVDDAYKVFEDMKRKHCEPDEYTYTIMIRMTGKIGKPDESLELFEEMLNKGYSPNLIAYNTMIQALANARMVDKAILLFSKMVENECRPSEFTYSVILLLLATERKLHKLDEVVEVSKKYMSRSIYAYLVRTLKKLGHASEAHRLFCNMWNCHERGDRDACVSMLECLCSAGKTTEAIDLMGKIHEKGVSVDTVMYNTVFSALGKLKQISPLHDLYEKMKQDGPLPDTFTYNILISSFGRAGKVDEAIKIFEELEDSDYKPDTCSYNSLINCLGRMVILMKLT